MIYKRKGPVITIDNVRELWKASGLRELDVGAVEKTFAGHLAVYTELLNAAELFRRVGELRELLTRLEDVEHDVQQAEVDGAEVKKQLAAELKVINSKITDANKDLASAIEARDVVGKQLAGLQAEVEQQRLEAEAALQQTLQARQKAIMDEFESAQHTQRLKLAALKEAVANEEDRLSQIKAAIARYMEVK